MKFWKIVSFVLMCVGIGIYIASVLLLVNYDDQRSFYAALGIIGVIMQAWAISIPIVGMAGMRYRKYYMEKNNV